MPIPARNQRILDSLKRGQQEKIAILLGVTRQNVNQILRNEKEISDIKFIDVVVTVTGASKQFLLYGTDTGVSEPGSEYGQETTTKDELIRLYRENSEQQRQITAMKSIEKDYEQQIALLKDQVKTLEVELEKYRSLKTRT
jgi:transcriptional regulator with XRE-family HTH domain